MLGIILRVKCLEESCQQKAAISMQMHACGGKCNCPNNGTDGTPPSLSSGVWRHGLKEEIYLFRFAPSERAKHKWLPHSKGGVCSTRLLHDRDCMEMRSHVPLLFRGPWRTKAVFCFQKDRQSGHSCFVKPKRLVNHVEFTEINNSNNPLSLVSARGWQLYKPLTATLRPCWGSGRCSGGKSSGAVDCSGHHR